jgi:hypothetical protein
MLQLKAKKRMQGFTESSVHCALHYFLLERMLSTESQNGKWHGSVKTAAS